MRRHVPLIALAVLALATPSVDAAPFDVQAHRGGRGLPADGGRGLAADGGRGDRAFVAENSLAAFRRSIDLGVPTLEMDLQVTRDRVLVVRHDATLDGMCETRGLRSKRIAELDSRDVVRVTCDGEPVPTFDEVLDLAATASYPVRVSPEIKLQDKDRTGSARTVGATTSIREFASLLVTALDRHGMRGRAIVQSFDTAALRDVRDIAPDLPTSALTNDSKDFDRVLNESGASILSPRLDQLDEETVARCHRRGVRVIPWVVNGSEAVERFLSWDVDGLISDRPDQAMEVVNRHARREASAQESDMRSTSIVQPAALVLAAATLATAPLSAAAETATAPPPTRTERALDLRDVGTVAVYPFTSGGNVDTFCTSLFLQEAREKVLFRRLIDPFELSITTPDGEPFQPQTVLPKLLEEARGKGADAILLGEGKWYDWGFRIEYRLIEVNEGRVIWGGAYRSGLVVSGPASKKDLNEKAVRELAKAMK